MSGLVESATAIISASSRRLEAVSTNIANVSTAGYKRQVSFTELVAQHATDQFGSPAVQIRSDLSQGALASTGNPLDLAISGDGLFRLRDGDQFVYSRQGQFTRAADGSVVNAQGLVLQQADGGDLVLDHDNVSIRADGTVLDSDQPVGRVGVFRPEGGAQLMPVDGSTFRGIGAMEAVDTPELRQGMTEASNVTLGDEMVSMMAALRQAESGAKVFQAYDDLLGRAISTFGEGGR